MFRFMCKKEILIVNQIFNKFFVCMWTARCTILKNTQNVANFEETEFLQFSQKSQFPKTDYRFWKSYKAASWD